MGLLAADFEVVDERPGFGIEDGSLVLFVVVGRVVIDGEENRQRDQAVLTQVENIILAGLTEIDVLALDVGVLKELGDAFVEPKGYPLRRAPKGEVRVLVIHGGEGVLLSGVETQQDVVLLRTGLEVAGEVEFSLS